MFDIKHADWIARGSFLERKWDSIKSRRSGLRVDRNNNIHTPTLRIVLLSNQQKAIFQCFTHLNPNQTSLCLGLVRMLTWLGQIFLASPSSALPSAFNPWLWPQLNCQTRVWQVSPHPVLLLFQQPGNVFSHQYHYQPIALNHHYFKF